MHGVSASRPPSQDSTPSSPRASGVLLRIARTAKGLTQFDIGYLARVHPSIVSLIEAGERKPTRAQADRIAATLGLPTVELFPDLAGGGGHEES